MQFLSRLWPLVAVALLAAAPVPAAAEQSLSELRVRVHVQGAVKRPGVYVLASGSRVADLLQLAGGVRPDAHLKSVNLARRLSDGEVCQVPTLAEARKAAAPAPRPPRRAAWRPAPARGPINLNTATAAQLDTLPGIGPGIAAAILRERARRGRFQSIEELREVEGIGRKRFERLQPLLRVD